MRTLTAAVLLVALWGCGGAGDGDTIDTYANAVHVADERCAAVGWSSIGAGDGKVLCTPPVVRSQEDCEKARGGWFESADGRFAHCVLPTPDAGMPCNDGSDCAGDCEAGRGDDHHCTASTAGACNPVHDGRHTLKVCPY